MHSLLLSSAPVRVAKIFFTLCWEQLTSVHVPDQYWNTDLCMVGWFMIYCNLVIFCPCLFPICYIAVMKPCMNHKIQFPNVLTLTSSPLPSFYIWKHKFVTRPFCVSLYGSLVCRCQYLSAGFIRTAFSCLSNWQNTESKGWVTVLCFLI